MYEIFIALSQLIAPFIPFITEEVYQNLKTPGMPESIHLCDYPKFEKNAVNEELEKGMDQIRALVESGRALRSKINIKGRHPLPAVTIICSKEIEKSTKPLVDLIKEELNVKTVTFVQASSRFMIKTIKPKYSHLGPKYKEKAKHITHALETQDLHQLYEQLQKKKEVVLVVNDEQIHLTAELSSFPFLHLSARLISSACPAGISGLELCVESPMPRHRHQSTGGVLL